MDLTGCSVTLRSIFIIKCPFSVFLLYFYCYLQKLCPVLAVIPGLFMAVIPGLYVKNSRRASFPLCCKYPVSHYLLILGGDCRVCKEVTSYIGVEMG